MTFCKLQRVILRDPEQGGPYVVGMTIRAEMVGLVTDGDIVRGIGPCSILLLVTGGQVVAKGRVEDITRKLSRADWETEEELEPV